MAKIIKEFMYAFLICAVIWGGMFHFGSSLHAREEGRKIERAIYEQQISTTITSKLSVKYKPYERINQIKDSLISLGCSQLHAGAYAAQVYESSKQFGLADWKVIVATMKTESTKFDPKVKSFVATRSSDGSLEFAVGLMQLKLSTFDDCVKDLGYDPDKWDVTNPLQNIHMGIYYLAKCKLILGPGSTDDDAVKAYKVGPGKYERDRLAGKDTNYKVYLIYLKVYNQLKGIYGNS